MVGLIYLCVLGHQLRGEGGIQNGRGRQVKFYPSKTVGVGGCLEVLTTTAGLGSKGLTTCYFPRLLDSESLKPVYQLFFFVNIPIQLLAYLNIPYLRKSQYRPQSWLMSISEPQFQPPGCTTLVCIYL